MLQTTRARPRVPAARSSDQNGTSTATRPWPAGRAWAAVGGADAGLAPGSRPGRRCSRRPNRSARASTWWTKAQVGPAGRQRRGEQDAVPQAQVPIQLVLGDWSGRLTGSPSSIDCRPQRGEYRRQHRLERPVGLSRDQGGGDLVDVGRRGRGELAGPVGGVDGGGRR